MRPTNCASTPDDRSELLTPTPFSSPRRETVARRATQSPAPPLPSPTAERQRVRGKAARAVAPIGPLSNFPPSGEELLRCFVDHAAVDQRHQHLALQAAAVEGGVLGFGGELLGV